MPGTTRPASLARPDVKTCLPWNDAYDVSMWRVLTFVSQSHPSVPGCRLQDFNTSPCFTYWFSPQYVFSLFVNFYGVLPFFFGWLVCYLLSIDLHTFESNFFPVFTHPLTDFQKFPKIFGAWQVGPHTPDPSSSFRSFWLQRFKTPGVSIDSVFTPVICRFLEDAGLPSS
jgi:hypothetical protein